MKNKKQNPTVNTTDITNLESLESMLGCKFDTTKKSKTTILDDDKKKVQDAINSNMRKFLNENYPQFYKEIETQVFKTKVNEDKSETHTIEDIKGYHLVFPTDIKVGSETKKGYMFMTPTLYCKGGKTERGCFYKVNGKTTYRNIEGQEIQEDK